MTATLEDLKDWYEEAKENGATHLIIALDPFDYDNYPVYVMPKVRLSEKMDRLNEASMQRIDEVYNMSKPFDEQTMKGKRAWDSVIIELLFQHSIV